MTHLQKIALDRLSVAIIDLVNSFGETTSLQLGTDIRVRRRMARMSPRARRCSAHHRHFGLTNAPPGMQLGDTVFGPRYEGIFERTFIMRYAYRVLRGVLASRWPMGSPYATDLGQLT